MSYIFDLVFGVSHHTFGFRVEIRFLRERTQGEFAHYMLQLSELSVLGLYFFRQFISFYEWGIFELYLSLDPLFPSFTWIDDWISVSFFDSFEKVWHILRLYSFLETIQKYFIVYVSVVVI